MLCSLSSLKDQDINEIKSLENELGHTVLAFSCHEAEPASLDEAKLEKIRALESSLGLSLVAVKAS